MAVFRQPRAHSYPVEGTQGCQGCGGKNRPETALPQLFGQNSRGHDGTAEHGDFLTTFAVIASQPSGDRHSTFRVRHSVGLPQIVHRHKASIDQPQRGIPTFSILLTDVFFPFIIQSLPEQLCHTLKKRSEERRVGKWWKSRESTYLLNTR